VHAEPFVRQNVFTKLDQETGRPTYDPQHVPGIGKRAEFCPSVWGGKDWPPAAYNPKTGYLYIPANENLCGALMGKKVTYTPGQLYIGVEFSDIELIPQPDAKDHIGELQAWDLNAGKRVWTDKFKSHNWGPVLTTGGGLVFQGGTNDRYFRAFDAKTGKLLWQQRTNSGITGVPSSYQIDGVQYIAVQSGWGVDAQRKQELLDKAFGTKTFVPQGGVLWVFALAK
jgi:alcohol dehydrogenase (cytochrome c)